MSALKLLPAMYQSGVLLIGFNKHQESDIQAFIDKYEKEYLTALLGCELYDLFVADLGVNGVPQLQIYLDIYNAFCEDNNDFISNYYGHYWKYGYGCKKQVISIGMVEMVKRFIYFEYVRTQKTYNTPTGTVVNENEVSRETSFSESGIFQVYNEGVMTYDAIQWFICKNETDYPKYNGIIKRKTSFL